jgi:hypothetical protein
VNTPRSTPDPAVPSGIVWDTEERIDLAPKEGHIRDNLIYITSALLSSMETEWGGVVSHVKTATNLATGEVTVFKASPKEPGAIPLQRLGAQNAAIFNFWRPLRKLNLKVPADRQFNVTPFPRVEAKVGTLFIFPINQRTSVPRNLKEEDAATSPTSTKGTKRAKKVDATEQPTPDVSEPVAAIATTTTETV